MKLLVGLLSGVALVTVVGVSNALADSSGSFSADIATTACTIDDTTGVLSNNVISTLSATLQTPNSSQTTIDLRPSFVTGLYTNTQVSKNSTTSITSSSAFAQVRVHVTIDGNPVAPDLTNGAGGTLGVIYDARFQQLSTNVFDAISACATTTTSPGCFIDLVLSTLSAHSMDFVAPNVGGGSHKLLVTTEMDCFVNETINGVITPVQMACNRAFAPNSAAACEGPGVLTVEQVKNFNNDSTICISSNGAC
jgi:hypothetical protein